MVLSLDDALRLGSIAITVMIFVVQVTTCCYLRKRIQNRDGRGLNEQEMNELELILKSDEMKLQNPMFACLINDTTKRIKKALFQGRSLDRCDAIAERNFKLYYDTVRNNVDGRILYDSIVVKAFIFMDRVVSDRRIWKRYMKLIVCHIERAPPSIAVQLTNRSYVVTRLICGKLMQLDTQACVSFDAFERRLSYLCLELGLSINDAFEAKSGRVATSIDRVLFHMSKARTQKKRDRCVANVREVVGAMMRIGLSLPILVDRSSYNSKVDQAEQDLRTEAARVQQLYRDAIASHKLAFNSSLSYIILNPKNGYLFQLHMDELFAS